MDRSTRQACAPLLDDIQSTGGFVVPSGGTVKIRIHLGIQKLQKSLRATGWPNDGSALGHSGAAPVDAGVFTPDQRGVGSLRVKALPDIDIVRSVTLEKLWRCFHAIPTTPGHRWDFTLRTINRNLRMRYPSNEVFLRREAM